MMIIFGTSKQRRSYFVCAFWDGFVRVDVGVTVTCSAVSSPAAPIRSWWRRSIRTDPGGRPAAASVTASPCPIRAPPAPGCRTTSRQSSRPGIFRNRCRSRWETTRRTTATGTLLSHPAKTTTSTFRRSAAWRRSVVTDGHSRIDTESLKVKC